MRTAQASSADRALSYDPSVGVAVTARNILIPAVISGLTPGLFLGIEPEIRGQAVLTLVSRTPRSMGSIAPQRQPPVTVTFMRIMLRKNIYSAGVFIAGREVQSRQVSPTASAIPASQGCKPPLWP
jgi:hypothetical protein